MAVKEQMARIYPPSAEELAQFLPDTDCGDCGFKSCTEFATALLGRKAKSHDCGHLGDEFTGIMHQLDPQRAPDCISESASIRKSSWNGECP